MRVSPSTSVTHMAEMLNQGRHMLQIASRADARIYNSMH